MDIVDESSGREGKDYVLQSQTVFEGVDVGSEMRYSQSKSHVC